MPPVMYSQPWTPSPSTTASAPLLRTAKRIPARPTTCSRPAVAPNRQTFPAIVDADGIGRRVALGPDDEAPAGQALADVVVGLAHEGELAALGQERAEALPGGSPQLEPERAGGGRDLGAFEHARQLGPERPVGGRDGQRTVAGTRPSRSSATRVCSTGRPGRGRIVAAAEPGRCAAPGRRPTRRRRRLPRDRWVRPGSSPRGSAEPRPRSRRRTGRRPLRARAGDPRPRRGRTAPPAPACPRTWPGGPGAASRCRSDRCRDGTGGPCRSRARRASPSRSRTPRHRAGPPPAGPGRPAVRHRCAARPDRAGHCGGASGGPRPDRAPTAPRRA